jgi:hypothetical protein
LRKSATIADPLPCISGPHQIQTRAAKQAEGGSKTNVCGNNRPIEHVGLYKNGFMSFNRLAPFTPFNK